MKRRPSYLANPVVWLPVAVLVGALAFLGYRWFSDRAERTADRQQVLDEVRAEVQKNPPDGGELSRLFAHLHKFEDHETARELLAAKASIELARDRAERAFALFGAVAGQPGAAPADQRLLARILLRLAEAGTGDRSSAQAMLQQVGALAEAAYADGADPGDLLVAWQAASRLGDAERARQVAARLASDHAEAPATRLVQMADQFQPEMPMGELDALRREFAVPPAELEGMRILVMLQAGDLGAASAAVEVLLARSPGVLAVRWAAALVFHACALGHAAGSPERAPWVQRRDAQLDWLLDRAAADDTRRAVWAQMREIR